MKQKILQYKYWALFSTCLLLFAACSKEDANDGSPKTRPGSMTLLSIDKDSASGGSLLTVRGEGLGDIRTIVFDKNNSPAGFYSTLNTENAILFRVPDTAGGGNQQIILTNSAGKSLNIPFRVLAYPSVTSVSNYNFTEGAELTLTGLNLADVTSVVFAGTSTEVEIVSAEAKTLVIKMPAAATVNRSALDITNATGKMTTSQEFVNIDNAYQFFTDEYKNGYADGSWGDPGTISSDIFRTGTASVFKKYAKGNWHLISFTNWWPGTEKNTDYKFLTLWIKGASTDQVLYLTGDKRTAGFGNGDRSTPLNVPANIWTYFKIPMSDANLWGTGDRFHQLGFWIAGPEGADETFYFDDVMLVK